MSREQEYVLSTIKDGDIGTARSHKERVRQQRMDQLRADKEKELAEMYAWRNQLKREIASGLQTSKEKQYAQAQLAIANTRIGILTAQTGKEQTMFDATPDIFS
jgi:hypothetical protein